MEKFVLIIHVVLRSHNVAIQKIFLTPLKQEEIKLAKDHNIVVHAAIKLGDTWPYVAKIVANFYNLYKNVCSKDVENAVNFALNVGHFFLHVLNLVAVNVAKYFLNVAHV